MKSTINNQFTRQGIVRLSKTKYSNQSSHPQAQSLRSSRAQKIYTNDNFTDKSANYKISSLDNNKKRGAIKSGIVKQKVYNNKPTTRKSLTKYQSSFDTSKMLFSHATYFSSEKEKAFLGCSRTTTRHGIYSVVLDTNEDNNLYTNNKLSLIKK